METRFGVKGTIFNNVFFTEDIIPNAKIIKHLHVEISRQNSNLLEVKQKLVDEAISCDAVAIMNFKYGQKKHQTWELVLTFKWDTESWHGEGDAVVM